MNIDKRIEGKGDLKEKENLMKLAKDNADIIRSEYNKEKKKGQSFIDWLDSKPIEYIKNIPLGLAEGGKVISLTDYLKQREKPKIKKIDLDSVAPGKAIADLTDAERKVVNTLLRLTFGGDE
jgi:hypothetical protein